MSISGFITFQKKFGKLFQEFNIRNIAEFTNFLKKGSSGFVVRVYSAVTNLIDVGYVRARDQELYMEDIKSIIAQHSECERIKIAAVIMGPTGSQSELIICTRK